MQENLLLILFVILSNFSTATKKKLLRTFNQKLDPFAVSLSLELSLVVCLFCCLCFRKSTQSSFKTIMMNKKAKTLLTQYAIICCLSIWIYFKLLSNIKMSNLIVKRSILSLLVGLIVSKVVVGEDISSKTTVVAIIMCGLFIVMK